MEEKVKIDLKSLLAELFGLKQEDKNQANIDAEVAKIRAVSDGVSWDDFNQGDDENRERKTNRGTRNPVKKVKAQLDNVQVKEGQRKREEIELEK